MVLSTPAFTNPSFSFSIWFHQFDAGCRRQDESAGRISERSPRLGLLCALEARDAERDAQRLPIEMDGRDAVGKGLAQVR